jgi:hypothetical protein
MPISFPQPPQHVAEQSADLTEGVAPVMPAQPVFTVGLDELAAAGLGEAQESVTAPPTWRASRTGAAGEPEVLELGEDAEEGALAAGDDRFGPQIREALALAEQDPRARETDYEARLFRVPALNLLALWLHAHSSTDLFVPLGAAAPALEGGRVYDDGEFMAALRSAAAQLRSAYDEAENPDELGS